jgi:hypothetical protein
MEFNNISIQFPLRLEPSLQRDDGADTPRYFPVIWLKDAAGQVIMLIKSGKGRSRDQTDAIPEVVAQASRYRDWIEWVYQDLSRRLDADVAQGSVVRRRAGMDALRAGDDLKELTAVVELVTPSEEVVDRIRIGLWLLMPSEELEPGLDYVVKQSRKQLADCDAIMEELTRPIPAWSEMEKQLD